MVTWDREKVEENRIVPIELLVPEVVLEVVLDVTCATLVVIIRSEVVSLTLVLVYAVVLVLLVGNTVLIAEEVVSGDPTTVVSVSGESFVVSRAAVEGESVAIND